MSNEKTNETLTPAQKGKYTRLANLKKEIKKLEEESKGVQTWIFENVQEPVSVFTLAPKEHLCLSTRENWATPDNDAVINVIGMEMFLKYASITKAKIAKAGGDTAVSDLVNKGELEVKSVTQFYTLKAKC